jgi:hypothetical protein
VLLLLLVCLRLDVVEIQLLSDLLKRELFSLFVLAPDPGPVRIGWEEVVICFAFLAAFHNE